MKKMVDGVLMDMTQDEIAEIDALNAANTGQTAVSMRQARLALLGAGLLTQVNEAVAAMTGPAGEAARIEWEYATEVRRDSALVSGLASAIGLTGEQLDGLFMQADAL